ncbi:MAG: ornithine cyclodeaminase family protein [Candidatus Dormibacteraceae bacterium]
MTERDATQPTQRPLVLSEAEVQSVLDPEELLERLAQAFVIVSEGRASIPPRPAASAPDGMLSVMPGYLPGVGLGTKQVAVYPGNQAHGLPSHLAVISLFDEATGALLCIMDGTHITTARTAGAAALSTRLLARPDASVLAILGAGVEGAAHLAAMSRVRDVREVRIASRTLASAERLAASDDRARAVPTFEEAVRGADVVCCCTNAPTPIVDFAWFAPGTHVTSVGFNIQGSELDEATVTRGHLFVETPDAFSPPPAGCYELQGLDPALGTEMGALIAGRAPGRRSEEEVTVYRSMGQAAEDLAAARLAYDRAIARGVGVRVGL